MKKSKLHKAAACTMIGVVTTLLAACGSKPEAKDLMIDVVLPEGVNTATTLSDQFKNSTADFSINLFKQCSQKEQNMMISPVSMLLAMSMTAQGAKGNTLAQLQKELYGGMSEEESRRGLMALRNDLFTGKKVPIHEANSIWFRDGECRFTPNQDFLQRNKAYLDAEIYAAKFDQSTVKDINAWVEDKTDGMIKELVKQISGTDIMHLINAVSFEDKWRNPYEKDDMEEDLFTCLGGTKNEVTYMKSIEDKYMKDQKSVGVIKPYKNGYSFVAILPNEGVSLSEYSKEMTGEKFVKAVRSAKECSVITKIPKFKSEYMFEAKDILSKMGMGDAFDTEKADFTGMGGTKGNLYINTVLQKTFIDVDENGTKASAATDVGMKETSSAQQPENLVRVELTRPFIYAIINDETSLPVFMGMMTTV